MTPRAELAGNPSAFVDWGGPTWRKQVSAGIAWLGPLAGKRVLEIGTRHGGMATFFALQGAYVAALDIDADSLVEARRRAARHGVGDRIDFAAYSGKPSDLPTGFDVVFTKSTLVLMAEADDIGQHIADSLRPGGRLLAVENARGPDLFHLLRVIRRRALHPHGARYFTQRMVDELATHLVVELVRWTAMPPTVLIGASRRPTSPG